MPCLYLIFSHEFTSLQEKDARNALIVQKIVTMPKNLRNLWQNVPPDLREINTYLGPIKQWLIELARPSDYVLVQGDFGATFILVKFAFNNALVPIYSTTLRQAVVEHQDGESVKLTHHFKHLRFRKYGA